MPARRSSQKSRRTNRIVGPKPNSNVCHHGAAVSSGSALTVTSLSWSSWESSSVLANAGISVRNRVVGFESSKFTSFLNVPWMSVPLDVISSTLRVFTCCRKNGLYGTRTRDSGPMAWMLMNRLTASSATKKTIQRPESPNLWTLRRRRRRSSRRRRCRLAARSSVCSAIALGYSARVAVPGSASTGGEVSRHMPAGHGPRDRRSYTRAGSDRPLVPPVEAREVARRPRPRGARACSDPSRGGSRCSTARRSCQRSTTDGRPQNQ